MMEKMEDIFFLYPSGGVGGGVVPRVFDSESVRPWFESRELTKKKIVNI